MNNLFMSFVIIALSWPLAGAITHITSVDCAAPAATTSCTLAATPVFGDLLISINGDTTTAPTLPAGWTSISSTAATRSLRVAWKKAIGNETTCGTWTSATVSYCMDYRGVDIQSTGPYGGTSTTTGTSATLSYATITMTRTDSTSWVLGCGWTNAATNADVAPSGMTLRSGTTIPAFACSDTNGGVASWATTNVTITSVAWRTIVVELLATPANSGLMSNLVHQVHYGFSNEPCTGACDLTFPFPASLSNNYLQVAWSWSYATTAPTVSNIYCNSDTGHATWTWTSGGHNELNTGDKVDSFIYYIAGAAAGCTSVTIVASSVWTGAEGDVLELYGIATASPIDTGAAQVATGTPEATAGSMTPGTSGDFIFTKCTITNGGGLGFVVSTNIFQPGGVTELAGDLEWSIASQGFIQTTAATLSSYMLFVGGSGDANCLALAIKTSNGAGSAPSGVYVVSQSGYYGGSVATSEFQANVFKTGDSLVFFGIQDQTQNQWTSVTDILANTGTTHQTSGGGEGYPAYWVACNITTSGPDEFTVSGQPATGGANYIALEVAGLKNGSSTACYDATAGLTTGTATASPYSIPSITASTSGGLIITMIQEGIGPISGITAPANAIYLYPTYTGQTDASTFCEGGGFSLYFSAPIGTSEQWTWTSPSSSAAVASAIALEAAPPNGPPVGSFYLTGMGKNY